MNNKAIHTEILQQAYAAASASRRLVLCPTETKNKALQAMAHALTRHHSEILFRNEIDFEAGKQAGLTNALLDRLRLDDKRIKAMITSLNEIAALPDPIGGTLYEREIHGGARLQKVRVPLGVVGMIYESRPNVTVESAALCLKSGNACILRGGKEAVNTNMELINTIAPAMHAAGIPDGALQFISVTDREAVRVMTRLDHSIDLIIARGSEQMVRAVREGSMVPVLGHGKGLCHTYVDAHADKNMAVTVTVNAKVQRPGVCNATESILVHQSRAADILPLLGRALMNAGVEIRGCSRTQKILKGIRAATEDDWSTEYLDLRVSMKIVDSLDEALAHIARYGSRHTEAIITGDIPVAEQFLARVDAASVMHNASTRLHDGGVYGLGSEIGISTGKLHARGSMGLNDLTTTKFIIRGSGQIR
ncbi:MAG: glutamate-5-semialdehyde dehydrogenase [Elusimicrobia bacterium]|nr:glutamate-5-semialdehyde dehydrogenase [Elusimicrobiota bacterium]MBD3411856.1 glutamate-5-semialdehyde dehydrogenase [Elusimicrobiota bacterium]